MALVWYRFCSFGKRGLIHCGVGPIDIGVGQFSPLFLWSTWAQLLWWRAYMPGRWSCLASVPLVVVVSVTVVASRSARWLVLDSPLFIWSAWSQSLWWWTDRQWLWSGLASSLVGVGSDIVVAGQYAKALVWSRLCSFGLLMFSYHELLSLNILACFSTRITTVIQETVHHLRNHN
jgi:hypothetical protein